MFIELVKMTFYAICGGFDRFNHRVSYFLDSPALFLSPIYTKNPIYDKIS